LLTQLCKPEKWQRAADKFMSTKQNSNNSFQFNPTAMSGYNSMQGPATQGISSNISNPYSNMLFNTQLGMGMGNNATQTSSNLAAQQQNWQARGMQSNSPAAMFMNQNTANMGRANASSLNNNLLLQAGNFRQNSIQGAMNYHPLQIGQKQQQMTSGLGSWLPQVITGATAAAGSMMNQGQGQGPSGETSDQILAGGTQANNATLGSWGGYGTNMPSYGDPGAAPDIGGWPSMPSNLPNWNQ
jgi:hypothetical protein